MITTKQPVSIPNWSHHVPGIFVSPSGATKDKPAPAVLLLHGTASNKNEIGDIFKRLAARLASRGYASLRIDFAGWGDGKLPENDTFADIGATIADIFDVTMPEYDISFLEFLK